MKKFTLIILVISGTFGCEFQACHHVPLKTQPTTTQATTEATASPATTQPSKYEVDDINKFNQNPCSAKKTLNVGNKDCNIGN